MSFEYGFGSKLGGVLAFRVVSVSIAFACVAKPLKRLQSRFSRGAPHHAAWKNVFSKDSDGTLGSFSGELCIQFRLEIRWKQKEKVAIIILFCGFQKLH